MRSTIFSVRNHRRVIYNACAGSAVAAGPDTRGLLLVEAGRTLFLIPATQTDDATARHFLLRSVATSRFSATHVDTNVDRVKTFLAAHPGTFFCNACLSSEVPVPKPIKVNQLIRALHGVNPYRSGRVVCFSCGEVRQCIACGSRHAGPSKGPPKNGNPS